MVVGLGPVGQLAVRSAKLRGIEQVIALDRNNPQVASRMARALEGWRKFTPEIQARIRPALEKVAATEGISPDVAEIVGKALG